MTVNSLVVRRDKRGFRYSANKYVGLYIADKIFQNFGFLLKTILYTSGLLYKIPGVVPTGQMLLNFVLRLWNNLLA